MPKQSKSKRKLVEFLVRLIAKQIKFYKYVGEPVALDKATKVVEQDKDALEVTIKKVFESYKIEGNKATFVTKPIIHEYNMAEKYRWGNDDKNTKQYSIGRATISLDIDKLQEGLTYSVKFEAKDFKHGHVSYKGFIDCLGGYADFVSTMADKGPSQGLMDLWAFCRFSRYGTKCGNVAESEDEEGY